MLKGGGEGRNRTYPPAQSVGAAVLKTATTTRHASLSQTLETSERQNRKHGSVAVTKPSRPGINDCRPPAARKVCFEFRVDCREFWKDRRGRSIRRLS